MDIHGIAFGNCCLDQFFTTWIIRSERHLNLTDIKFSTSFPICFLYLIFLCDVGFLPQYHLAPYWHCQYHWFQDCRASIHDNLQRHGCSAGMELVSFISCNCWNSDWIRCVRSRCRRNQERSYHRSKRHFLEYGRERNRWISNHYSLFILCSKLRCWGELTGADLFLAWCRHIILVLCSSAICPSLCPCARARRAYFYECGLHYRIMVCESS